MGSTLGAEGTRKRRRQAERVCVVSSLVGKNDYFLVNGRGRCTLISAVLLFLSLSRRFRQNSTSISQAQCGRMLPRLDTFTGRTIEKHTNYNALMASQPNPQTVSEWQSETDDSCQNTMFVDRHTHNKYNCKIEFNFFLFFSRLLSACVYLIHVHGLVVSFCTVISMSRSLFCRTRLGPNELLRVIFDLIITYLTNIFPVHCY